MKLWQKICAAVLLVAVAVAIVLAVTAKPKTEEVANETIPVEVVEVIDGDTGEGCEADGDTRD